MNELNKNIAQTVGDLLLQNIQLQTQVIELQKQIELMQTQNKPRDK